MRKKYFFTSLLALLISSFVFGQLGDLKKAQKLVEEGNEFLEEETYPQYQQALQKYLEAHKILPGNPEVNYKVGACYLNTKNKTKAIPYLEEAVEKNPTFNDDIYFLLAKAYHLDYQFDKAIEYYKKYEDQLDEGELRRGKHVPRYLANLFREKRRFTKSKSIKISGMKGIIYTHIAQCKTGKKLVENKKPMEITNLGSTLNSPYPEYGPVISADEAVMFFTGRKSNTTGGGRDNGDGKFYEDVYMSQKEDSIWTEPDNDLGGNINSESHESPIGLSSDGQTLFLYKNLGDGGDIYISHLKGNKWSEPERMPEPINSKYAEKSVSLGGGGRKIYFVSDRPGGYGGGRDIYVSTKDESGNWQKPKNLGPRINTNFDEEGVFIHPDGRTLYFSSKGHSTMGGYDVFKTIKSDTGWSIPQNMGVPVNTPDDDVFFVMSASGKTAYFSTVRKDGLGEQDLYKIAWKKDTMKGMASRQAKRLTVVKGVVTNKNDSTLGADIKVMDNEKNKLVAELSSNSKTGKYLITLPAGKNYGISISKDGYLFKSKNFNIPDSQAYEEVQMNIELEKVKKGAKITLENIFYDYDKAELRDASKPEIDRMAEFLKKNSNLKVEISGHTDSKGKEAYNRRLSEERARSVVDYLVNKHGIDPDRLKAVGYGEKHPVAPNIKPDGSDNPKGRQLNRRTELEILNKKGEKVAGTKESRKKGEIIPFEQATQEKEGIIFSVQIAVTEGESAINDQFFSSFDQVIKRKTGDKINYLIGMYVNYKDANDQKEALHKKGVEGAFVVAFRNGNRIDVKEAIRLTKNN